MWTKSQRLIATFGVLVMIILALLVLFKSLNPEYFFVLSLISFLIIIELAGPFMTKPKWRSRVNIVIVVGVIIFGIMVYSKVMEIIGF
ncbi:hypothetical protein [Methanocella sp. MCL-LM]|uniref:hypothetical protein n=1 Tax=Methanocella sp. MCL-LM TaxID=3412035 RepID=UPI003C726C5E